MEKLVQLESDNEDDARAEGERAREPPCTRSNSSSLVPILQSGPPAPNFSRFQSSPLNRLALKHESALVFVAKSIFGVSFSQFTSLYSSFLAYSFPVLVFFFRSSLNLQFHWPCFSPLFAFPFRFAYLRGHALYFSLSRSRVSFPFIHISSVSYIYICMYIYFYSFIFYIELRICLIFHERYVRSAKRS